MATPERRATHRDAPGIRARFLDARRDRGDLSAAWARLTDRADHDWFQSPGWVETWLDLLPARQRVGLVLLQRGDEPVGGFIAGSGPVRRRGAFGSPGLFLGATGDADLDSPCVEYNAFLMPRGAEVPLRAILDAIPLPWAEFQLPALDERRAPAVDLHALDAPYRVVVDRRTPSPYVDLEKVRAAAGDYLSLLGPGTRQQIRRSYRLYEARGPIRVEVAASAREALAILDDLTALHQAAWQDRGRPGAFASAFFSTFHRRLIAARFRAGEIQMIRVSCGSDTVGCLYNFVHRGAVHFYQSGFRYESDPRLKPGLVCHAEAVGLNARSGHREYDFLAGDGRYKASLSTDVRHMTWARVRRPTARCWLEDRLRALHARLVAGPPGVPPRSGTASAS